jgi:hypothetical protein
MVEPQMVHRLITGVVTELHAAGAAIRTFIIAMNTGVRPTTAIQKAAKQKMQDMSHKQFRVGREVIYP